MQGDISSHEQKMVWIQCYCWFHEFLTDAQRVIFLDLLDTFIEEMTFVGVEMDVTEEMKTAISGWAVFLVLNRPLGINWYHHVKTIMVYPGTGINTDTLGRMKSGYYYSQVHLAWEEVRDISTKAKNNENTVLHEFAHALDHIDRQVDGYPRVLLKQEEADKWKAVFRQDYLHSQSERKRNRLWDFFSLYKWNEFDPDDISCVDLGELFAVSTEKFFEHPSELKKFAADIYDCLMMLYRVDPIADFPKC